MTPHPLTHPPLPGATLLLVPVEPPVPDLDPAFRWEILDDGTLAAVEREPIRFPEEGPEGCRSEWRCPYAPGDVLTRIVEPGVCCRCGKRTDAPVHTCNRSRPNAWSVKAVRAVRVADLTEDDLRAAGVLNLFREWWTIVSPGHPFVTAWAWLFEIERTDDGSRCG